MCWSPVVLAVPTNTRVLESLMWVLLLSVCPVLANSNLVAPSVWSCNTDPADNSVSMPLMR